MRARPSTATISAAKKYYVRRGREFVAAWDKRTDVVVVLAPAGMSYHQAALEAAAGMERGEYI